jgi:hypothetical protein
LISKDVSISKDVRLLKELRKEDKVIELKGKRRQNV